MRETHETRETREMPGRRKRKRAGAVGVGFLRPAAPRLLSRGAGRLGARRSAGVAAGARRKQNEARLSAGGGGARQPRRRETGAAAVPGTGQTRRKERRRAARPGDKPAAAERDLVRPLAQKIRQVQRKEACCGRSFRDKPDEAGTKPARPPCRGCGRRGGEENRHGLPRGTGQTRRGKSGAPPAWRGGVERTGLARRGRA